MSLGLVVVLGDEQLPHSLRPRTPRYDHPVKKGERIGNWSPEGKAERAALQRDYRELTPAQRAEQVFELSRFMSRVAEAGRRRRLA